MTGKLLSFLILAAAGQAVAATAGIPLPDDPAGRRGILSWLSQPRDGWLHEAGSYGWPVTARVPAEAVKGGKVTVRIEADSGLAAYGPAFGRDAQGPRVLGV